MKNEIATILRDAADKIETVCVPTTPAPRHELPTEPAIPDPPEGFHKPIMGPIKGANQSEAIDGVALWIGSLGKWDTKKQWGGSLNSYYTLRKGSKIAKLNGLEPDGPKPARREGWLIPDKSKYIWYDVKQLMGCDLTPFPNQIHVREVLPGDPTIEQVEELVAACEGLRNTLIGFGLCAKHVPVGVDSDRVHKALAPFRKP